MEEEPRLHKHEYIFYLWSGQSNETVLIVKYWFPLKERSFLRGGTKGGGGGGAIFFRNKQFFGRIQWKNNTLSDPAIFNAKLLAEFEDKLLFRVQAINNMNHKR